MHAAGVRGSTLSEQWGFVPGVTDEKHMVFHDTGIAGGWWTSRDTAFLSVKPETGGCVVLAHKIQFRPEAT